MNKTNLVVILLLISIVLCFVMPLIGLLGLIACSIFFIVQGSKNKSRAKQCSVCGKKLNIYNTGVGGRLKDGGQLCTSCFQSLSVDIAISTEKYNKEEIIVFQEAEKERRRLVEMDKKKKEFNEWLSSVQPVLKQGETVVHLIRAEYNNKH
ncbi:MAG: hypothetical protein PHR53_07820, partial [Bacteroidales bacterium]|nr:hypothetical protein [Bacteroidales bacterium]